MTSVMETASVVVILGALLAFSAVVLAVRHIYLHLCYYSRPEYQLHIVRILAMVPIYSVTSWFALVLENEQTILILELIRDSYEAYVIYNFVVLLINYGGGDLHLCRYLEDQPRMSHPWPGNIWLPPLKLGPAFLNSIRASVLQFVFIKPAGSSLRLYVFLHGSSSQHKLISLLLVLINNASVSIALYGLVLFYHAAHELLLPHHPFEKFLSVKAVVFFSFWQGVALSIAIRVGLIRDVEGFSADAQATGLQDFLICLEMAIAAVTHYYVFSYSEYHRLLPDDTPVSRNYPLLQVVDFRDVLSDAKDRLTGGVGFEAELRDEEPIVPGVDNILGDGMGKNHGYIRRGDGQPASISNDLMSSPWHLRAPKPVYNRLPVTHEHETYGSVESGRLR